MSALKLLGNICRKTTTCGRLQEKRICSHVTATTYIATCIGSRSNVRNPSPMGIGTSYGRLPNYENRHTPLLLDRSKLNLPFIGVRSLNFSFKCRSSRDGQKTADKVSVTVSDPDIFGSDSKLGLFAKFKLMYKKYWYVLIPVHVITSIGWFGGFYYLSKSGVDLPSLLQYMHLSEAIIHKVQSSNMGHWAIAYLCYKVATPLRYAVTLGGTTVSIKYLVQTGLIKPMPSKKQIFEIYEQKMAERSAAKEEKSLQIAKKAEKEKECEAENDASKANEKSPKDKP